MSSIPNPAIQSDHPAIAFSDPPIVETLFGLQFAPLPTFNSGLMGLFWAGLNEKEWPTAKDAPPVTPQFELFGEEQNWGRIEAQFQFRISSTFSPRLQIVNQSRTRMIQIQDGQFMYNWIKGHDEKYPRYNQMRKEFDEMWERFVEFTEKRIGKIILNQWEVTYVNHLFKGELWDSTDDWSSIFPMMAPRRADGIPLESMGGEWHFEIVPKRGRLHAQVQSGRESQLPDGKDLILFKLTTRGPIKIDATLNAKDAVDAGLNLGHDTIVNSFVSLTSSKAHRIWRRTT